MDTAVVLSPEHYDGLLQVRDAYLATTAPDDDEAIDEAWFSSVSNDDAGLDFIRHSSGDLWLEFTRGVVSLETHDSIDLPHITTRGQLRQLAKCLGIDLHQRRTDQEGAK